MNFDNIKNLSRRSHDTSPEVFFSIRGALKVSSQRLENQEANFQNSIILDFIVFENGLVYRNNSKKFFIKDIFEADEYISSLCS